MDSPFAFVRPRGPSPYHAVEVATAILVAGCVIAFGVSARTLVAAFFCAVLATVSAIDIAERIIPNRIVLPAAAIVLVGNTAIDPGPQWILGAVSACGFLLVAALVYPAGMGMGDVKLALLMGAALGRTVPVALIVGMLAALIPSIFLVVRYGSKGRKMGIPFGPFLALGSIVALFWGGGILDAYLSTLH